MYCVLQNCLMSEKFCIWQTMLLHAMNKCKSGEVPYKTKPLYLKQCELHMKYTKCNHVTEHQLTLSFVKRFCTNVSVIYLKWCPLVPNINNSPHLPGHVLIEPTTFIRSETIECMKDKLPQFHLTCWHRSVLVQPPFECRPEVFDRIKIGRLCRPLHNIERLTQQPLFHHLCRMLRVIVMLKDDTLWIHSKLHETSVEISL